MKIKSLVLKKFHNDEWLFFLEHLLNNILVSDCVKTTTPTETLRYTFEEYQRMVNLDCQVDGQMVADADQAADQAWSCLNAQLKIELVHPEISHREAAARLYAHLLKYRNPTRLTYDQEYAKLNQLLDDLSKASEEDLIVTHAYDWFIELKKRCQHFMDVYHKRINHSACVDPGTVKMARQATESAYKSLVIFLESSLQCSKDDQFESIISELNSYIDDQKTALKNRASQSNKSDMVPELPETIEDMDMDEDELLKIDE